MKKKAGIIAGIAVAVGGLLLMMGMGGNGEEGPEEEEGDPEDEPAVDPGTSTIPKQQRKKRVPAKTTMPFNEELFSNKAEVMGRLAGLSAKYTSASVGGAAYKQAIKEFQGDWNFLAAGDYLSPHKLNSSKLIVDATAGYQTLRALEWAVGMSWPNRLNEAGLTT